MSRPKTQIVLLMISVICLSASCRVTEEPKIEDLRQLSVYFHFVDIAGKEYIDVAASRCYSRQYRHSKEFIGPLGNEKLEDMSVCDRMIGYSPRNYTKLHNFMQRVRSQINLNSPSRISEALSRKE